MINRRPANYLGGFKGPRSSRDNAIDAAKGWAIVLIVLGHVLRGLDSAGLLAEPQLIDRAIYMSHLSVFALTSALFVRRGVEKRGSWAYVKSRALLLLYLYILWTLIQGVIKLATSGLVNRPTSIGEILAIWAPDTQLWFLPWLLIVSILTVITKPWRSSIRAAAFLVVATLVSLLTWGLIGPVVGTQGLGLVVFFAVGVLAGPQNLTRLISQLPTSALFAIVAVCGIAVVGSASLEATPPTWYGDTRTVVSVALGVSASVAGVCGILCAAQATAILRLGWVIYIGRHSLEIFLAHIIAAAAIRILLVRFGIEDPLTQVVFGLFFAVALPLALAVLAPRLHVSWIFQLPARKTAQPGEGER